MADLYFSVPTARDAAVLAPYFTLRPNKTCDSGLLDTYIWKDYYKIRYCLVEEKALFLLMENETETFSALPYCKQEDLPHYFGLLEAYFNEVLKKPLKIYLADEEGIDALQLKDNPAYLVKEEEDLKDYLYLGEELRTLPGKRFHQKRNQISKFTKTYEGRWEYRTLSCADEEEIRAFMDRWFTRRALAEEATGTLDYEKSGICEIIRECCTLSYHAGGIYIDGQLEAVSIATCNEPEQMAVISVEKANPDFPGIYQMINQQFLVHEFPDIELVNREDDMGLPGLRQAKSSYNPVGFARKYMVLQKSFAGYREELHDFYEEEIASAADADT